MAVAREGARAAASALDTAQIRVRGQRHVATHLHRGWDELWTCTPAAKCHTACTGASVVEAPVEREEAGSGLDKNYRYGRCAGSDTTATRGQTRGHTVCWMVRTLCTPVGERTAVKLRARHTAFPPSQLCRVCKQYVRSAHKYATRVLKCDAPQSESKATWRARRAGQSRVRTGPDDVVSQLMTLTH